MGAQLAQWKSRTDRTEGTHRYDVYRKRKKHACTGLFFQAVKREA